MGAIWTLITDEFSIWKEDTQSMVSNLAQHLCAKYGKRAQQATFYTSVLNMASERSGVAVNVDAFERSSMPLGKPFGTVDLDTGCGRRNART